MFDPATIKQRRRVELTMPPNGVVPFAMWMADYVCKNLRPDEIQQYEALSGVAKYEPEVAALGWCNTPGPKFGLVARDGTPLVIGGYIPVIDGVLHSWMAGTPQAWETHWRSITKAARWMGDILLASGARRLETVCLASRTLTIEWYIHSLRMQPDGVAVRFGRNGEDAARFVRLKEEDNG